MEKKSRKGPITAYRSKHGLSLGAFGAIFGVNKSTVLRWEDGVLPVERALEIEQVTGISRHKLSPRIFGPAPHETSA
jgi:DNA-binding transcriptional regulator YdaS (Cro superfamily)